MPTKDGRRLTEFLHGMIVARHWLLIRQANYLRGLVGLPAVRAGKDPDDLATAEWAVSGGNGLGRKATRE
jgi:hypothetical protein